MVGAALCLPSAASPAPNVLYGIQDDWLLGGPGSYGSRLRFLKGLGPDVVRVNVRWNEIARPACAADEAHRPRVQLGSRRRAPERAPGPGNHRGGDAHGHTRWANGGRAPSYAPTNPAWFGSFAYAAARRYPQVRHWVIWNEPNKNWSLRPTSAATYVPLLNAAYAAIKRVNPRDLVAGGVTAPRGGTGDVAPIDWIRGMRAAGARLDAYAHHPYPLDPNETPFAGGCTACESLTLASLDGCWRKSRVPSARSRSG